MQHASSAAEKMSSDGKAICLIVHRLLCVHLGKKGEKVAGQKMTAIMKQRTATRLLCTRPKHENMRTHTKAHAHKLAVLIGAVMPPPF